MQPEHIGKLVRLTRRQQNKTQRDIAAAARTGLRFVIELEQGKATCQIGKILAVLDALAIKVSLISKDKIPIQTKAPIPKPDRSVRDTAMDEPLLATNTAWRRP